MNFCLMTNKADNKILKTFGDNIRKYRLKQSISQSQLAFEINTTLRQIQRIEKGEYNAGILYFIKIAEALNVDINKLSIS